MFTDQERGEAFNKKCGRLPWDWLIDAFFTWYDRPEVIEELQRMQDVWLDCHSLEVFGQAALVFGYGIAKDGDDTYKLTGDLANKKDIAAFAGYVKTIAKRLSHNSYKVGLVR